MQYEEQEYLDYASEGHSYVLEIFSEFGIIGFAGLVGIIIIIVKSIIKQTSREQKAILLAILALFAHSCVDFDLSFMYMLVIFFALLAMVETQKEQYKYIEIIGKVLIVVGIIISIYFSAKICITKYVYKQVNPYSTQYILNNINLENEEIFEKQIKEIVSRRKYASHIDMFYGMINYDELSTNQYIILYNVIKNESDRDKNSVQNKLDKIKFYTKILDCQLDNEQIKQDCQNSINQEAEEIEQLLNDPERCRLSLSEISYYKGEIQRIRREEQ